MTNYSPEPNNEETPNYYGRVPNNPIPQPPVHDPYAKPQNNPEQSSNPYAYPQYTQPVQHQQYGNPYQQQPYQQPYGVMSQQVPTNKNAIISLVTSLATLFILCGIPVLGTIAAIAGIVFGHKGLKETQEVPNSGRGIAIAGTICGYAALVASILVSGLVILLVVASIAAETSGY